MTLPRAVALARTCLIGLMWAAVLSGNVSAPAFADPLSSKKSVPTTTPIKHVVVIYGENNSFDHYFGTYPHAANTEAAGEPNFTPLPGTPSVNGFGTLPVAGTLPATGNNINEPGTGTELTGIGIEGAYATANNMIQYASGATNLAQSGGTYTTVPATLQPFRLSRAQATTCDMDHNYTDEQIAYHSGQIDLFAEELSCVATAGTTQFGPADHSAVMGYYDGNTVQGLWNYAQHFAMSDNAYGTTYGPTALGHIELISGNTHGVVGATKTNVGVYAESSAGVGQYSLVTVAGGTADVNAVTAGSNNGTATLVDDARAYGDDCVSASTTQATFGTNRNIGDLLNAKGVTWGYFEGGFRTTTPYTAGPTQPPASTANAAIAGNAAVCGSIHEAGDGTFKIDYNGSQAPFQFYTRTQNLHHFAPGFASVAAAEVGSPAPTASAANAEIGNAGPANHLYDVMDLFNVTSVSGAMSLTYTISGLKQGVVLPAVTYIKAPGFMTGHPQYSNPLLEQQFYVQVINALMQSPYWPDMVIFLAWDDSDGWYDHVQPPLVNPSNLMGNVSSLPGSTDSLTGTTIGLTPSGACGVPAAGAVVGRCGYGPRLPFLVISPWSKVNFVDHTIIDQTSILRFIEDNWNLGRIDLTPTPVSQGGSFDQIAGSLYNMFDFTTRHSLNGLILNPSDGTIAFADDRPF